MSRPPAVTIRPATSADLSALGRLGSHLMRLHHEFDAKRFMAAAPEVELRYAFFLGEELEKANTVILVAEKNSKVLGYVYGSIEGDDYMTLRGPAGMGHDLMVDPDHRGQGLGLKLLQAMLLEFKVRGVPRVVLSTAQQNSSAQRLLARAGFRPTMIEMTRELDDTAS